jgi:hypothetical protein
LGLFEVVPYFQHELIPILELRLHRQ